jgi:hypothetical protein
VLRKPTFVAADWITSRDALCYLGVSLLTRARGKGRLRLDNNVLIMAPLMLDGACLRQNAGRLALHTVHDGLDGTCMRQNTGRLDDGLDSASLRRSTDAPNALTGGVYWVRCAGGLARLTEP